jgi:hypothetical protein
MTDLTNTILGFIESPNSGALMISGDWGCGKTYHIENVVFPKLKEKDYIPIRVSLFGITSIDDLPLLISEKYTDNIKTGETDITKKIIKKGKNGLSEISSVVPKIREYIDIEKLINKYNKYFYYRSVPANKVVIVLDDLERAVKTIDIYTLLGAINDLVEQRKYKIIVVSNNSYLHENEKDNLIFKEKVIEKTIVYNPDIVTLYKDLLNEGKYGDDYKSFMCNSDCISIINPNNSVYKSNLVKSSLSNIRILKFAIIHFYKVFECLWKNQNDKEDEDFSVFLKALWACTVGLSVEYKRNKLTSQNKNEYSEYSDSPLASFLLLDNIKKDDDGLVENFYEPEEDRLQKEEWISSSNIIRYMYTTYVENHNLPIIVSTELFDLITSGYYLNETSLLERWKKFKEERLSVKKNPAYSLLEIFLNSSIYTFPDDKIPSMLNELASHVEKGDFNDNVSYVNAATYLLHYQSLTSYSEDELKRLITNGIDKMYLRIADVTSIMKNSLNMIEYEIPEISKWVIKYEKGKMEEVSAQKKKSEIEDISQQFSKDIEALSKRITSSYGDSKTPDFIDTPILSYIPEETVIEKMKDISPREILALGNILNFRFEPSNTLVKINLELPFIHNIEKGISMRKKGKRFSDYVIEDYLNKIIEKIKEENQNLS